MRGKKYNEKIVYDVMSSMIVTNNAAETSKILKIPESTVRTIYSRRKDDEEFVELHDKKKKSFSEHADETISKVWKLIDRKIDRSIENHEEIEKAIETLSNIDEEDISIQDIKDCIKTLKEAQELKATELTNIFGIMYDKKRLNEDKSTENVTVNYEQVIKQIEGDEY